MVQTTARNATLADMADLLKEQHARKVDIVAPASKITAVDGNLVVKDAEPIIDADGVTDADGVYTPTAVADEGVAEKLAIPVRYLRAMREARTDLYDANVNGWLHGRRPKVRRVVRDGVDSHEVIREGISPDPRSFLIRAFRGDDGGAGVARAVLSDSYSIMDNLDVLSAALDGVKQAGVDVEIDGCDLSDRRMYVRVKAPQVSLLAPQLLAGYRSPFSGQTGEDNPTMFAGFQISNSETGCGAFSIVPRLVVQVCNNGMCITRDAMRKVHLGGKLDEGVIRWSQDTQQKNLELVTAQARDAVATFLDVDYMRRVITRMEAEADVKLTDAADTVKRVTRKLQFTQEHTAGILDHFIRGGQTTAGGVMHAVTAYTQTVDDPDTAAEFEAAAERVLTEAAAHA